jgi:hypothetical protein
MGPKSRFADRVYFWLRSNYLIGQRTPTDAGWSSPVVRQAHNLKVAGSNPIPAELRPGTTAVIAPSSSSGSPMRPRTITCRSSPRPGAIRPTAAVERRSAPLNPIGASRPTASPLASSSAGAQPTQRARARLGTPRTPPRSDAPCDRSDTSARPSTPIARTAPSAAPPRDRRRHRG